MFLIAAAAALVAPSLASGSKGASERTPASCDGKPAQFHIHRGRAIIRHGYAEGRIPDATPMKGRERRALRAHKFCVDAKMRDPITRYRDRSSKRYHRKLAKAADPYGSLADQYASQLAAIRACESGGDYGAVDPSGTYFGAYQFDLQTWGSVGGYGNPAAASVAEQDYRAALLYSRSGSAPWPVCGV